MRPISLSDPRDRSRSRPSVIYSPTQREDWDGYLVATVGAGGARVAIAATDFK